VNTKEILGVLSILLIVVAYAGYFRSMITKHTKPHMFSWFVWGVVNGIVFVGQFSHGGGAGSWATGMTSLMCIGIAAFAAFKGERNITKGDWAALIASIATILLWLVTKDPLASVILATIINMVGLFPTWRKSYYRPYEENLFTWSVISLRSMISLAALEHYSLVTTFFPLAIMLTNSATAGILILRRHSLRKTD
jgi:hypothetical protein